MHALSDPDTDDIQSQLSRKIEHAVSDAIDRLSQAARGQSSFTSDHQLRACVTLARMTRLVILNITPPEPERSLAHPDHSPEEVERLMNLLEGKTSE
jgi:hypothetical protein